MKNSKVIANASWVIICKIAQSLINLVIGMITARYLGPSNYGVISYVSSIVAFAVPIMQLGLNHTLVKEIIKSPDREGEILGTAMAINIFSGVFSMIGTIAFVVIANADQSETILVCILYSFTLLFQATEMTQYWFQSKLLSKYPSIATVIAYTLVALYKIYLLKSGKSLIWFSLSNVFDYLIISILLLIFYMKVGGQKLSFNLNIGRAMISRSKYYIIPSLMVMIFQHTDKIMINLMIGDSQTGMYSAAISCIGISGFVFSAVIDSARPVVLDEKGKNAALYEKRMVQLYSIIAALSFAQSIFMTLLAKPLVFLLYGKDYFDTIGILRIAVWYVTFSYFGSVRNVWILAEAKQRYLLGINVTGAIANVILNLCLIPIWGAEGAAIASLITQFFTNVIIGFLFKPIRHNNYLMLKGLNPKVLIDLLKGIITLRKIKQ